MNSIPSVSSTSQAVADTPKVKPGKFEQNKEKYGPVGAAVIGTVDAVGDAASTIVSLSSEGLHGLAGAAASGYQMARSAAQSVGSGIETLAGEIGSAAHSVSQVAGKAAEGVEGAVSSVVDGIGDVASSAAGYVTVGVAAGKQFLDEIA